MGTVFKRQTGKALVRCAKMLVGWPATCRTFVSDLFISSLHDDKGGKENGKSDEQCYPTANKDTGSRIFNLELSQRRADLIKALLESKNRIVVEAKGLGQDYPIASNDTEEGKRLNRRVDVLRQVLEPDATL